MGVIAWLKARRDALGGRLAGNGDRASPAGAFDPGALIADGLARHEAGDLRAAERAYRAVLDREPRHADALRLLGTLLGQRGDLDGASRQLERALEIEPEAADAWSDLGSVHRLRGRHEEASACYRRAIEHAPRSVPARANLGELLAERGDLPAAAAWLQEAADLAPAEPRRHVALARVLGGLGDVAGAAAAYERALELRPADPDALNDLAATRLRLGDPARARECLEVALRLRPNHAAAHHNLARALDACGEPGRALEALGAAADLEPGDVERTRELAERLRRAGDEAGASRRLRACVEARPDDAEAHLALADALAGQGRAEAAATAYRQALERSPESVAARNNLGTTLIALGRLDEAAAQFAHVVELAPGLVDGHANLAGACQQGARLDEAVAAYERGLAILPAEPRLWSQLAGCLNYCADAQPQRVLDAHRAFGSLFGPCLGDARVHAGDRAPERRLRVGYVSPDFRFHSVSFFMLPVVEAHDRERVEVVLYCAIEPPARPDERTREFESRADRWRDVSGLDDAALAERIAEDGIDVLVDLSGHSRANRLGVFARRAAPVQVTWLGYPNTTGVAAMDWRLSDEVADPPGVTDAWHTERLLRLPRPFLCYRPPGEAPPVPERGSGAVTFASFNELPKVTPAVIATWAALLHEVPESRLMLKATALDDPDVAARIARAFGAHGIDADRIDLRGRVDSLGGHLALYAEVDVGLDTFPYNGTTTTCEALHMGVPVVTFAGAVHATRVGEVLLRAVGLDDLVARDESAYLAAAAALARDPERRARMRAALRGRLAGSALGDESGFARALEDAYARMWRERCESPAPAGPPPGRLRARAAGDEGLAVRIRGGAEIHVPHDLARRTPYVLVEHEDWLSPALGFVRRLVEAGARVLEIGAGHGVYGLTAARATGSGGRVWCVEPAPDARAWLERGREHNRVGDVLEVIPLALSDCDEMVRVDGDAGMPGPSVGGAGTEVRAGTLDRVAAEHGIEGVDLVRIAAADAIGRAVIAGAGAFFERESPLLLLESDPAGILDRSLVERLRDLGFGVFRLLPGPGVLVPVAREERPERLQLELFACPPDRARALCTRGLLLETMPAPEDHVMDGAPWPPPWAAAFGGSPRGDGEDVAPAARAARLHAAAYAPGVDAARRVARLRAAHAAVAGASPSGQDAATLHTRARLEWELGLRSEALCALETLDLRRTRGDPYVPEGEFVPASAEYDSTDPGESPASWCEAAALDQLVRHASRTGWSEGESRLNQLERLRGTGFAGAGMERRRQLARMRAGRQDHAVWSPALEGTLNPDLWGREGSA